jgi:DnaJ-class molecular chaperone
MSDIRDVVCYHCDGNGNYKRKQGKGKREFTELVFCHVCFGHGKITSKDHRSASLSSKTSRFRERRVTW